MSFAVYVHLPGEKPATNGVRYATEAEATSAGHELLSRWLMPTSFDVRETNDPVNYAFVDGRPVRLTEVN